MGGAIDGIGVALTEGEVTSATHGTAADCEFGLTDASTVGTVVAGMLGFGNENLSSKLLWTFYMTSGNLSARFETFS